MHARLTRTATVLALLLLTGCSTTAQTQTAAPVASTAHVDDLLTTRTPHDFAVADLLPRLTAYINAGTDPIAQKLGALRDRWDEPTLSFADGAVAQSGPETPATAWQRLWQGARSLEWASSDLNGDGTPEYVVIIGNLKGDPTISRVVLVVYRDHDRYAIDHWVDSDGTKVGGSLHLQAILGTPDLTGDGRPEIVLSLNTGVGAAGGQTVAWVGTWSPGDLHPLVPPIVTPTAIVKLDGKDLTLGVMPSGGAAGSALQRQRTDRYRFVDGRLRLVDRTMGASTWAYHLLQDALIAESFHKNDQALQAYVAATDVARPVVDADVAQNMLQAKAPVFAEAVRSMAALRRALLVWRTGDADLAREALGAITGTYAGLARAASQAKDPEGACAAATTWAKEHPGLVESLNAAPGYLNGAFDPSNLCGPISFPGDQP